MKTTGQSLLKFAALSILLSNVLLLEPASANALVCKEIFTPQTPQTSTLDYVEKNIADLAALRSQLDQATASGSSSSAITALNADYYKKEKALVEYIDQHQIITRAELVEKLKQEMQKNQSILRRESTKYIKKNYVIDGTRVVMHRIEPGSIKMGYSGEVKITNPFEMMATQTTQIIWRTVAELANRRYPGKYEINPDPSYHKGGLRPVETVSYEDVQTWLKALNELSAAGEISLFELISDHKQGDIYRLPTETEWDFVLFRGISELPGNLLHPSSYRYDNLAWFRDNSKDETHPVAQKKPMMINNQAFYDMNGNVFEWVPDKFESDPERRSNADIARGGSWGTGLSDLEDPRGIRYARGGRGSTVGFRFARDVQ